MPKLKQVCRYVRTKNAGPFWVTVDFFFNDEKVYTQYKDTSSIGPELVQKYFDADPDTVKVFYLDSLFAIKLSFVRPRPQAWWRERDMHSGQLFARLLEMDVL